MWNHQEWRTPHPTGATTIEATPITTTRFLRSRRDRVIAGVAGGLGARLGVDPIILRITLVIMTLAGGAGVMLYAVGYLISEEPAEDEEPPARPFDLQQSGAVGLIALGVMLLLRAVGLWLSDAVVWPALLVGIGSAIIWARGDTPLSRLPSDPVGLSGAGPTAIGRVAAGAIIALTGLVFLLTQVTDPVRIIGPLAGILLGSALLFGPWLYRLWLQLNEERDQRAQVQAREEVAAHLHDSVLQTLALIQRSSDNPRRAVALARRQERELRAWLYADRAARSATLTSAVEDLVGEVEAGYAIDVEPVVVGDTPLDGDVAALLQALREALVNAAKHAEVEQVSLFVEVESDRVLAFVRDRGKGFDPDAVPDDRLGLRRSVVGRVRRHGGGAMITSALGEGTEVEAWVPRRRHHEREPIEDDE